MKKTLKRMVSASLAFLMIISAIAFCPMKAEASGERAAIRFDDASKLSLFSNANNLHIAYSDSENSVLMAVTGTGSDPYVLLNVEAALTVSADAYKYVVLTYRTPVTNSAKAATTELFMSAGSITGPTAGCSVTFSSAKGYNYSSQIIDMSSQSYWTGTVHNIRIDAFAEGSFWDSFFLSSVTFCTSLDAATAAVTEENARASGVTANISESTLASNSYSLDTYVQTEYWKGNIVYNESVYPLLNADGSMSPISLMYDAKRIISVRDGTLGTEYKFGLDYTITADGKLLILTTGNIPTISYSSFKLSSAPSDTFFWQPCRDGSYTYFCEGGVFHRAQLAITYTHEDEWEGPVPESQTTLLSKTVAKLQNKEKLTVVFNGDSITYGANASGLSSINVSPQTPLWADMTIAGLKAEYGYTNISYVNTAVGGMTSQWGAENAYDNIAKYVPDLVFIAFGMNDGTLLVDQAAFKANIQSMMSTVRAVNPDCEFILVSPMLANPDTYFSGNTYLDTLKELKGDGVAVVDMTSIHSYLLGIKKYSDMTGNNVNHPNDFLIRFYAQAMLAALSPSDLESAKSAAISALNSYTDPNLYLDAEKALLEKELADGIAAINACESESAVTQALTAAKEAIDKLKTAAEYEFDGFDYTNIVFNSSTALSLVTGTNNVSISIDYSSDSAEVTALGDDPWLRIRYPSGTVSANTYKYAVIVYKVPDEVTNTSSSQVFFTAGSTLSESESDSIRFTPVKGSFTYQLLDLSSLSIWNGTAYSIRIDPFDLGVANDTMYIHSVALFKDSASAKEYGAKEVGTLTSVYTGSNLFSSFTSESSLSALSSDGKYLKLGDINRDGRITSTDLIAMKYHIAGLKIYSAGHPDINSDGRINNKDSLQLKRIIYGATTSPGKYYTGSLSVSYDDAYADAVLTPTGKGNSLLRIDLSDKNASAETFNFVTLTYLLPSGSATQATVSLVTGGGTSTYQKTFELTPSESYQSVTLDFSEADDLSGNVKEVTLSFPSSATSDSIFLDSVVLSDTKKAATRALDTCLIAANRQAGFYTPVTGQTIVPFNGTTAMATYAYYYEATEEDTYKYNSKLVISFDRQPDEAFDRFSLTYTSTSLARGVITYVVDGTSVQDEFFLEASTQPTVFSSLIDGYFDGSVATEIISVEIYPVSASESAFSLKSVETENYDNYSDTVYLENDQVKAGIYLAMGGGISYYEKKDDNDPNYSNLLNSYDVGRLVQQSYYGIDQSPYVLGDMGGTPWRYNPVQGGDVANNPSRIIDIKISSSQIYIKVRPMDWGHDGNITPSYMENTYTLYDSFLKVDNRFVDFSGYTHTLASQELPAFYTISALTVFNMYNGSSPWTDDAYTSYPNLKFWGDTSSQYYNLNSTSEYWYAFTDTSGFGIGVYVPNVTTVLAGRFIPEVQSYDSKANATCYFAPLRQMTLKSGKALTYSYLICAGDISTIRNTFKNNKNLVDNTSLSSY